MISIDSGGGGEVDWDVPSVRYYLSTWASHLLSVASLYRGRRYTISSDLSQFGMCRSFGSLAKAGFQGCGASHMKSTYLYLGTDLLPHNRP